MALFADTSEVPHRVVEDDENVGHFVKHCEEIAEAVFLGVFCVFGELGHDGGGFRAGKIVDAQMEDGVQVWNSPLHRGGSAASFGDDAKQHRSFDVVVVGEGYHAFEAQDVFDLIALELKGGEGVKRGRPIRLAEVDDPPRFDFGDPALDLQTEAERPVAGGKFGDKREAFFGAIGVAVQRDGRGVAFSRGGVLPKAGQFVQRQPPLGSG